MKLKIKIILIILFILILYVLLVFYLMYENGYFEPAKTICSNTYLNFSNLTFIP
jgi:hypothetical protein